MNLLSIEERDQMLSKLNEQQKHFLLERVKRGKKTVFANEMALDKGYFIPDNAEIEEIEHLLDEWILEDYIDNGFINLETPCECGRPLRYQYIVKHKLTGDIRRFGITHFEEHTGIRAEVVKAIKSGFSKIDYEMDELLEKLQKGWSLNQEIQLPTNFIFPADIQEHLDAEIPLLNRQIKKLKQKLQSYLDDQLLKQQKERESYEQDLTSEDPYLNEIDQFSFEFFEEDNKQDSIQREAVRIQEFSISFGYQEAIRSYLEKGITSTRILCELLIKEHHAPKDRYISGKPKIYSEVCFYLESLCSLGEVKFISKKDQEDRLYSMKVSTQHLIN
ncbi:DUF3895 domain-containing protein [Fictibacillus sp. KIGAM418]|uniref:DUF3895 domain-containing protein n=1 Tax=Fictibacillus marinisediminis TaxID=2878389 RepID=A0A9X2BG92_9BACL|nr:DUF3895 domain-containing protein [Fictibacillus marinisediminis]MCK6259555.1 DUF3895 domain-containing protein [Fictibacillus marinisediminis]